MATFRSERDLVAVSPPPTAEEAAALSAALAAVLAGEQEEAAPEVGRWARAGRMEAHGLAPDRPVLRRRSARTGGRYGADARRPDGKR